MATNHVKRIRKSGLSIYDSLIQYPELLIDHKLLERILNQALVGLELKGENKTRSKKAKTAVCEALGYPLPKSFKRVKPRFPGQNFDVYVQKRDNLQIHNDEISASRRYVIIRVDNDGLVTQVRVESW